ncbi:MULTISPECIES: hypothetical protein [unclassified Treponema]|uniref:hypothetical protein n=1 Tax=unclassified Treponema TaxID=2638727 RepID=UPI0020A39922|nr:MULTISPECIES: hypothetical protein [unclassified Treponema]UTC68042.1 hypothetical protein E4O06_05210 [Treponema sp. OMZ 789]UTC70764.1 hypothetical protein E4O01_05355 [Treponema sp. OMZ 790]UTC73484.1 hypothetical protein E4O02_05445 [Treponema sp. OMZ 791]UTC73504.1 hypothetical protein E4O02_05550 [Treponema sp. OMZ 791]
MNWKLIYFLLIVLFLGLFAGFNMKNSCDVSLIFYTFENIPVYVSNIFSFLIGLILTIPFFFGSKKKKNKQTKEIKETLTASDGIGIDTVDLKKPKKSWFKRKKESKTSIPENNPEIK